MNKLLFVVTLAVFVGVGLAQSSQDARSRKEAEYRQDHLIRTIHGIIASISWVVFFPVGAILMPIIRSSNAWWIHGLIQAFAIILYTASVATGIVIARRFHSLNQYHQVIGLLIFVAVFLQAIGGYLHHYLFRKYHRRTVVSYTHIWFGRILITLGMINGGLGLLQADNGGKGGIAAYAVIAGVIWIIYVAVAVKTSAYEQKAYARKGVELDAETKVTGRVDPPEKR